MNIEVRMLSKILNSGNFRKGLRQGLRQSLFHGDNEHIFRYISDYYGKYKETPPAEIVTRRFPDFTPVVTRQYPYEFLISELQSREQYTILRRGLKEAADLLSSDVDGAYKKVALAVARIQSEVKAGGQDTEWSAHTMDRLDAYNKLAKNKDFGIPLPWPTLNQQMLGLMKGHLVTIAGRPSVGKSWLAIPMALKAWRNGFNVLIVTKEMATYELSRRLDAAYARLCYPDFRGASLSKDALDQYKARLRKIEKWGQKYHVWVAGEELSSSGVLGIQGKIEEYDPDLVIVDGVYLLKDDEDADSKTAQAYNITRAMKRLAKSFNIPVVQITQMGRGNGSGAGGDRLSKIQWSDSYGQDCLTGDTLITTTSGVVPIAALEGKEFKIRAFGRDKEAKCVSAGRKRLTTIWADGRALQTSPNEQVLIVDSTGVVKWERSSKLQKGDYLIWAEQEVRGGEESLQPVNFTGRHALRHPIKQPVKADADLGWLLGALIGDGCAMHSTVSLSCGYNEEYAREALRIVHNKFGIRGVIRRQKTALSKGEQVGVNWYSVEFAQWCEQYIGEPHHKRLMRSLLNTPWEFRRNLLAGLIDSDGHIDYKVRQVSFKTEFEDMATNFRLLCQTLGYYASVKSYASKSFEVRISTHDLRRSRIPVRTKVWLSFEGFTLKNDFSVPPLLARVEAQKVIQKGHVPYRSRGIEGQAKREAYLLCKALGRRGVGLRTLNRWTKKYRGMRFVPIECVQHSVHTVPMWDIIIKEEDKRLIANGFVVHNSDELLEIYKEAGLEPMEQKDRRRTVELLKQREGNLCKFNIHWDFSCMDLSEVQSAGSMVADNTETSAQIAKDVASTGRIVDAETHEEMEVTSEQPVKKRKKFVLKTD